jgi:chromosome segregation ATPase
VPLEKRIRAYTRSLLRRPEIITEQTEAYIASERDKRRRDSQAEEAALRAQLEKLATKRARYLEQHAEELITTEALKSRLAEIDRQRIGVKGEIAILKDRESHLKSLEKLARDFVLDLPDLLKDLSEDAAADLYRDVYERLGYQLVVPQGWAH